MITPARLTRRAGVILSLVVLAVPLLTGPVASGQTRPPLSSAVSAALPPWVQPETPSPPSAEPPGAGPWVVRAYFSDRQMVNELATWTEPWEVHYSTLDQGATGYLVVDVDRAGYERLLEAGFVLEIDERLTAQLHRVNVPRPGQTSGIPGYECYRTVEETFTTAQNIVADHPHLAAWIDVGDSWEMTEPGGNPGYDIMVLRLTNSAVPGPKPKLFVMTAVHAREYTTAELNTRFAEYLVDNYGVDADVTWLLDYHELHLLLQANPDGRKHAEAGLMWRKNTNENYCGPTSNYRGADLNRNFEFQWGCCGGSSGNECDETYRGPSPASEPETQAVQNYVRSQFPDQREDDLSAAAPLTATGVFLDIHSYSELVLWPWGFTSTPAPNATALQTLGRKFAYFNGYWPEQAIGLYPTDGTTDDFAYGDLGLPAYTFELGTAFFQACSTFENTILPDNLPALVYAAKVARTPYLTPAGPDALEVAVAPAGVVPGAAVQLTATIDDTRYNNDNGTEPTQDVVAAEYYVDVPPWVTTTVPISYSMMAVDGVFDETVEAVQASVDTTALSNGRHILFVRGQDAAGNWGPFSAEFLYILDPAVAPVIEGYVRDASTNAPLEATATAGVFQAQTDPATGYYHMMVLSDTYDVSAVAAGYGISTVTGIEARDYHTVRQDFFLTAQCGTDVLTDDVELGNLGWTVDAPWAITAENSHSASHSWTDSPGGDYGSRVDASLTSPTFDLYNYQNVALSFWHIYDIETGYDYAYVEYSTDGGTSWTQAASYTGYGHTTWAQEVIPLPALDGASNVRIRFRFYSDVYLDADGWHVDDIWLYGDGPTCVSPLEPTAEFTSTSPVVLGTPMIFTNLVSGTPPLDYWWNFGDGLGTSIESDPTYVYTATGTFSVTLIATNSLGSDSVSHPVTVLTPTYGITLTPATAAQTGPRGGSAVYVLNVTNAGNGPDRFALQASGNLWTSTLSVSTTAELPALGTADVQLRVDVPLSAAEDQTDTVTITATSQGDGAISATSRLTTTAVASCVPVSITQLSHSAPAVVGTSVHFTATVSGDLPITYSWDFGDLTPAVIGPGLSTITHTYYTSQTYTVTLEVDNVCAVPDRRSVPVSVRSRYQLYLPLVVKRD